jgi:2-methylcitrate dehydratase
MRPRGLDNVFYVAVSAAAASAKLLALDVPATAHALSIAVTSSLALGATRHGELAMWKGCAAANAAHNGVFAALLAAEGMSGPDAPIEGVHGLRALLGRAELPQLGSSAELAVERSALKAFAAEYHAQGPIALALELRTRVAPDDIATVTIDTYWFAWHVIGSEREKWRPATRETADHSLPYIIAAVLIDGRFSQDIFCRERLCDPAVHVMSDRITIREDPQLTAVFPKCVPCRMEIITRTGERMSAATQYPLGHPGNPMSDQQTLAKFAALAQQAIPLERIDPALRTLHNLEQMTTLDPLFHALRICT